MKNFTSVSLLLLPIIAFAQTDSIKHSNTVKNIISLSPFAVVRGLVDPGFPSNLKLNYELFLPTTNKSIGTNVLIGFYPLEKRYIFPSNYYSGPHYYFGIGYSIFMRGYGNHFPRGFYYQLKIFGYNTAVQTGYFKYNQGSYDLNYYGIGGLGGYHFIRNRFSFDIGLGLKLTTFPINISGEMLAAFFWYTFYQGSIFDGLISFGYTF